MNFDVMNDPRGERGVHLANTLVKTHLSDKTE